VHCTAPRGFGADNDADNDAAERSRIGTTRLIPGAWSAVWTFARIGRVGALGDGGVRRGEVGVFRFLPRRLFQECRELVR